MRRLPTQLFGRQLRVIGFPALMTALLLVRVAVPSIVEHTTHAHEQPHITPEAEITVVEDAERAADSDAPADAEASVTESGLFSGFEAESRHSPLWMRFIPHGLWPGVTIDCSTTPKWWPIC